MKDFAVMLIFIEICSLFNNSVVRVCDLLDNHVKAVIRVCSLSDNPVLEKYSTTLL